MELPSWWKSAFGFGSGVSCVDARDLQPFSLQESTTHGKHARPTYQHLPCCGTGGINQDDGAAQ